MRNAQVTILNSLRHPNVLRFDTWYETRNHIWVIMEYCTGGDLLNLLLQGALLPPKARARVTPPAPRSARRGPPGLS